MAKLQECYDGVKQLIQESKKLGQQIMKDHWMNVGHEEEELKPHIEPETDFADSTRIGVWF